jgi:hypothetical protein
VHSLIKTLIWAYIVLLLIEGALRKWVFPSLADPLLVVRDPVLLAIYAVALAKGCFPTNPFVVVAGVLAALSMAFSVLGGHTNILVILYGVRINYLHLPLIWIMGTVLDRRDVERIGAFLLLMAIPMTLLMVAQFRAPMDAVINRGVGSEEIGQIFGADDRIRAPGLFSFISGPQLFFPFCAAFFFNEIGGAKRLPWYLLILCGLAIAVGLPISISRTVMLGTGIVALVFVASLPLSSARPTSLFRPLLLLVLVGAALTQVPVFREGFSVFMMRWDDAAGENAAAWTNVVSRTASGFTNPYFFMKEAPFFGYGIGAGSNVGARLLYGDVGFALAEEEWGKVLLELGPFVGAAFIIFRISLVAGLGLLSWNVLRQTRNALPLLIWSASAAPILQGQWGPPTILGFSVIGAGLLLGALRPVTVTAPAIVASPEPVAPRSHRRETLNLSRPGVLDLRSAPGPREGRP